MSQDTMSMVSIIVEQSQDEVEGHRMLWDTPEVSDDQEPEVESHR